MNTSNNRWVWAGTFILMLTGLYFGVVEQAAANHYGPASLLPALVTLVICFATRNVILALFMGVVMGGLISGQFNILQSYLIPSLGSKKYAEILLVYLWALGGLIGLWNKNGGAIHFAEYVAKRFVKSRGSAKLFAWTMGILFHQGGTISTVLAGTTVKPVSDREGVSHEELSYIVDSTASPVATIIPLNAWPLYIAGLVPLSGDLLQLVPDEATAQQFFFAAIPFNFYGWLAILFTLLFALDKMPFVGRRMQAAIDRVKTTGELDSPHASPMISPELNDTRIPEGYRPGMADFVVPIGLLIGISLVTWVVTDVPRVFEAFGISVVSAMITSGLRGMPLKDIFEGVIDGIKGVTVGAIILGLAVTLGTVSESLGTSQFIIESTSAFLSTAPYILPALLLLICMVIAFSIGSSWGTYAVIYPIALPLAYSLSPDPTFFTINFGAILGGAVFGDQCSPISDTTILSAMACGADLMDHVFTQLPMALAAAGISAILYIVVSYIVLM